MTFVFDTMSPLAMSKSQWRLEFKRRLTEIVQDESSKGHARSSRVSEAARVLTSRYPGLWLAYSALPGEPDLEFSAAGVQLAYPRLESETEMKFYTPRTAEPRWSVSRFGIREPDPIDSSWRQVDLTFERVQGALVPGLGFDRRLRRLGRGRGFYDRFLKGSLILKVGVSFAEQLVEELPHESHDVDLDALITDRETIWNMSSRVRFASRQA